MARGITVVEGGANGSMDLDDPIDEDWFNRAVYDSGAILVGAGTPDDRVAECWTNYGSRMDVSGWGDSVATLGYGDLATVGGKGDVRQYYTNEFAGTSSAAAMVAGAAAQLQGIPEGVWQDVADAQRHPHADARHRHGAGSGLHHRPAAQSPRRHRPSVTFDPPAERPTSRNAVRAP